MLDKTGKKDNIFRAKKLQNRGGSRGGQSGFTMVELAIVLVIIGLMTAGVIMAITPIMIASRNTASEANMNHVVDVISVYAQRNGRIPCPANPDRSVTAQPFGAEVGSGSSGSNVPALGASGCTSGGGVFNEGIVPYRTLGLGIDDVRDGWGNYLTYRVSPTFARNPADTSIEVHRRCRVRDIWVIGGDNRNPQKARFCCPDTALEAQDVIVRDENNVSLWPYNRDNSPGNYNNSEVPYNGSNAFDPATENVTTLAFALISHGANQSGAKLENGTRMIDVEDTGTGEVENRNNDRILVSRPYSTVSGGRHFDDFIVWRTQDQLYAETGEGSCAFP